MCSPALLERTGKPLRRAQDLAHYVLLDLEDPGTPASWLTWSNWFDAARRARQSKPAGLLGFNYFDQIVRAALAGQGVALGRLPLIADLLQDGSLVAPLDARAQHRARVLGGAGRVRARPSRGGAAGGMDRPDGSRAGEPRGHALSTSETTTQARGATAKMTAERRIRVARVNDGWPYPAQAARRVREPASHPANPALRGCAFASLRLCGEIELTRATSRRPRCVPSSLRCCSELLSSPLLAGNKDRRRVRRILCVGPGRIRRHRPHRLLDQLDRPEDQARPIASARRSRSSRSCRTRTKTSAGPRKRAASCRKCTSHRRLQ